MTDEKINSLTDVSEDGEVVDTGASSNSSSLKFVKLLLYNYAHYRLTTSSVLTILQSSTEMLTAKILGEDIVDVYTNLFENKSVYKKIHTINFEHDNTTTKTERKVARCRQILESDDEILGVIDQIGIDQILPPEEKMLNLTTEAMCEIYNDLLLPGLKEKDLMICHPLELSNYLVCMKRILDFFLSLSLSVKDKKKLENNFKKLVELFDRRRGSRVFSNIFYPPYVDTFLMNSQQMCMLPPTISNIVSECMVPSIEEIIKNLLDEPLLSSTSTNQGINSSIVKSGDQNTAEYGLIIVVSFLTLCFSCGFLYILGT
jgi:hypothetical protein